MSLLRAIVHFFKTWFLPLPAHDDPRLGPPPDDSLLPDPDNALDAPTPSTAAAAAIPTETDTYLPPQDFHEGVNDISTADPTTHAEEETPDPDYPERVPMHTVAPPEGAEERASRSPHATNPFSPE